MIPQGVFEAMEIWWEHAVAFYVLGKKRPYVTHLQAWVRRMWRPMCLVAKGDTLFYGIDYFATFSHVASLNSVRVLISIVVNLGWPLSQLNVKNAFIYGDL